MPAPHTSRGGTQATASVPSRKASLGPASSQGQATTASLLQIRLLLRSTAACSGQLLKGWNLPLRGKFREGFFTKRPLPSTVCLLPAAKPSNFRLRVAPKRLEAIKPMQHVFSLKMSEFSLQSQDYRRRQFSSQNPCLFLYLLSFS